MKNGIRRFLMVVLTMCMISCMALPGIATADSYLPSQLSAEDMQALKNAYVDIRPEFERYYLPHFVLDEKSTGLAEVVLGQDPAAMDWVYFLWTTMVSEFIFNIQKNSADTYQLPEQQRFSELTSDEFYQLVGDHIPLVQEAGLSAVEEFDVSYTELTGNGVLMLLAFQNTDTARACQYIGIAVEEDGNRHYYFAESLAGCAGVESFPEMGAMFFCGGYVPNEETNYWYTDATEAAFVESIHASLKGELEFVPILYLEVTERMPD